MAIIKRGKRKGEEVKLDQWCNDWFIADDNMVLSPLALQLTPEEVEAVRDSEVRGQAGHMFLLYHLTDDGTFVKRNRY